VIGKEVEAAMLAAIWATELEVNELAVAPK